MLCECGNERVKDRSRHYEPVCRRCQHLDGADPRGKTGAGSVTSALRVMGGVGTVAGVADELGASNSNVDRILRRMRARGRAQVRLMEADGGELVGLWSLIDKEAA